MIKELTVGEMFSGPGGIGIALNRAKTDRHSFKHVWATDYDKDTCETYKRNVLKNSPDALSICKDIRELDIKSLPIVDGLLFGFPCNDFSRIGQSKGFNGKYGQLYKYGVEYLNYANPMFFLAENVSGLRTANEGEAFKTILHDLNHAGKHGYTITVHLYKFEEYGVPQARHRYILVGIRGDLGKSFWVPAPLEVTRTAKEALEGIPEWATNNEPTKQTETVTRRLSYIKEGENLWQAEHRMPEELRIKKKGVRYSSTYRRLHSQRPSYTVTGSGGGGCLMYHYSENRSLTNRERARLQTFPDDFVFVGGKESVRKQIGMAVPCLGAQIILKALLWSLEGRGYPVDPPSVGMFRSKSINANFGERNGRHD